MSGIDLLLYLLRRKPCKRIVHKGFPQYHDQKKKKKQKAKEGNIQLYAIVGFIKFGILSLCPSVYSTLSQKKHGKKTKHLNLPYWCILCEIRIRGLLSHGVHLCGIISLSSKMPHGKHPDNKRANEVNI